MDVFLIYLICFGVGLVFTLISTIFAEVGSSHEVHAHTEIHTGHAEAGFGDHDMPGFSALSPTTIATFVTAFGGFGMIFAKIGFTSSPWISAPLAAVCGLAVSAVVLSLFRTVFRHTQSSSESRVARLVGAAATVITPIPENGVGEIAYVHGGSRYTAPVREEQGRPVANGQTVKITRIVGTQFFVTAS